MSEQNGQPKQTVVEEGTALRGSLASNGQVLVMGRVDGEVSGVAVEITETGAVSGRVKTPALRSRVGLIDPDPGAVILGLRALNIQSWSTPMRAGG